ncbi:hypothetical protein ALC60_13142, partial [Trachymyrmex zeteki]
DKKRSGEDKGRVREWKEGKGKMREERRSERKEKKRNIIIKEVEGEIERKIRQILDSIEKSVVVEKIRKLEAGRREKGWMGVITMGSVVDKGRILRGKGKFRGRDVWIEEDLTWKERR